MSLVYPSQAAERDRWVVEQRPARAGLNPRQPYAYLTEEECDKSGSVSQVATIFLTNRECPWRCVMCDLWRNTLEKPVGAGDIPAQIDYALERLGGNATHIKLYNSGSFFDAGAIPVADYGAIATRLHGFERVIVESHPALVGERALQFQELLRGDLEVAMGLETVHPEILPRLNKKMSLVQFAEASNFLGRHGMDLRVFVLVKPPFLAEEEAAEWAKRSVDFAFDCGATAVSLIPTRSGNGAMEAIEFVPPRLGTVEAAFDDAMASKRGRVLLDLWDVQPSDSCAACFEARVARMRLMNLRQTVLPAVLCEACGC